MIIRGSDVPDSIPGSSSPATAREYRLDEATLALREA